ncbi:hypothetical protein AB6A40_005690 [Gnathostoma spinigerum]|uniref:Kinesin-like protein n=1 Tax=Gnathostoma spinigerum TaxID=75299 RepID=A0ABD6EGY9_9BILA
MEFCKGAQILEGCRTSDEVDAHVQRVRESFLETHVAVKNQLIRNLENIIDEQESRIRNMQHHIEGRTDTFTFNHKKALKGISLLSLDFGALSEENLSLKNSLINAQKEIALLKLRPNTIKKVKFSTNSPMRVDTSCQTTEGFRCPQGTEAKQIKNIAVKENGQHHEMDILICGPSREEENNNSKKRRDREMLIEFAKNIKELRTTERDLKTLVNESTLRASEEISTLESKLQKYIGLYVSNLVQRYKKEVEMRKRLHNKLVELNGNIRVLCRVRPSKITVTNSIQFGSHGSTSNSEQCTIRTDALDNTAIVVQTTSGPKRFFYDRVFSENDNQNDVFEEVSPLITSCMDGFNVCIFAYGHTGSGKTYTMEGTKDDPGINHRSILQLFQMNEERKADVECNLSLSMLEVYNEKIRDLLSATRSPLSIRIGNNGQLDIPGLNIVPVKCLEDIFQALEKGRRNRVVSSTESNDHSSRSHLVTRVYIHLRNRITNSSTSSRLNLVDLAGSERVSHSGATGLQLLEAQSINRSLSELGNVVSALRNRQCHIPFRNCQLTRLLEDCLNGESKTMMIVQISPDSENSTESISSLTFADKIGSIKTKSFTRPLTNGVSATVKPARPTRTSNFVRFSSVRGRKNQDTTTE